MSAKFSFFEQVDWITALPFTCDLLANTGRLVRLDLKQIAEFARPADVAEFDIAHRLRETRACVLARARNRTLAPAAIRPLPAARIAGGARGHLKRHARA